MTLLLAFLALFGVFAVVGVLSALFQLTWCLVRLALVACDWLEFVAAPALLRWADRRRAAGAAR